MMWLSLSIMEAEVSFAYALEEEATPPRAARATKRGEKNFIITYDDTLLLGSVLFG